MPLSEEIKPVSEPSSPSIVVITRPTPHYTPQPISVDLSKAVPLTNGGTTTTIFNLDESQASLNLSTESSGYVSNSTTSSLNQSGINGDDLELEKSALVMEQRLLTPIQSSFNALPMPTSASNGRRRTISSNSNRYAFSRATFLYSCLTHTIPLTAARSGVHRLLGRALARFTTSSRKTAERISKSASKPLKSNSQSRPMRKRRRTSRFSALLIVTSK